MPSPKDVLKVRAFLRMRPASCSAPGTARGLLLSLRDPGGLFPEGLTAQWLGPEATAFYDQHQAELTPGRCLDLELFHLRSAQCELRARVNTCQLAPLPPSWIKHADKAHPATPTHQEHPPA